jgi:hypothetical protein
MVCQRKTAEVSLNHGVRVTIAAQRDKLGVRHCRVKTTRDCASGAGLKAKNPSIAKILSPTDAQKAELRNTLVRPNAVSRTMSHKSDFCGCIAVMLARCWPSANDFG